MLQILIQTAKPWQYSVHILDQVESLSINLLIHVHKLKFINVAKCGILTALLS